MEEVATLLIQVKDEGPRKAIVLLKDALVISSNDRRVLLELMGVRAMFLKVLNILLTRASGIVPLLDDASATHMLLINGGKILVLLVLFKAFEESKHVVDIVDRHDAPFA